MFFIAVISRSYAAQVPYVDVCDDAGLATVAKGLNERAQEAGVAATISAGIWPGVDQLMAVEVRNTTPALQMGQPQALSLIHI